MDGVKLDLQPGEPLHIDQLIANIKNSMSHQVEGTHIWLATQLALQMMHDVKHGFTVTDVDLALAAIEYPWLHDGIGTCCGCDHSIAEHGTDSHDAGCVWVRARQLKATLEDK